ncbi:QWRF motif-containing protein 7-like [Durio zibethinus]|uniref:QWRF motif-containing protein 7-like n=1 Tax=Durio zibethinus TaxID=66656 RepID=A0A6P5WK61_DURZI|nr:QWRF motif-containing protein 7-like [Durio zibethinus]
METPLTSRHHFEARTPSPQLLRSRSGTSALTLPENRASSVINSSQRLAKRSKSITRSRTLRNEENVNPATFIASMQKKPNHQESRDEFVRFLQRGSPSNSSATKGSKPITSSPSAWALSPGRSSPLMVAPEPQGSFGTGVRSKSKDGGVSRVLKYFRQKKVSPVQEEEYHRFRLFYNRMLQWRFVNARAEIAMAAVKIDAQDKLFGVWLRILKIRNSTVEKKILLQKLIHEIKLHQIVGPQFCLLNEWVKLEGKNYEAVSRVIRKLSAILVRVPLIHDAKADVESIYEAIGAAIAVMDGIEATIIKIFSQPAEKMLCLVTKLISMVEQEKECLEEMEKVIALVPSQVLPLVANRKLDYMHVSLMVANKWASTHVCINFELGSRHIMGLVGVGGTRLITHNPSLAVSEQSLRAHLIQAAKESWRGQTD